MKESLDFNLSEFVFNSYISQEIGFKKLIYHSRHFAKLSSSCSSSQIQLNWDSLIISVKPPTHPTRERYFQFTQEAEIWYAS